MPRRQDDTERKYRVPEDDSADSKAVITVQRTRKAGGVTEEAALVDVLTTRIGIYGWRKYLVYILLLLLICFAIINIGLIVYVWNVLSLNSDGAGAVRFYDDKIRVEGSAEFLEGVTASSITSFREMPLELSSTTGVSLTASSSAQSSQLELTPSEISFAADSITTMSGGTKVLELNEDAVVISTGRLLVDATTGLTVSGAIQSSRLQNERDNGAGLTIASVGQDLTLSATRGITLSSEASGIAITAATNIEVATTSTDGAVIIDSSSLVVKSLGSGSIGGKQLCVCGDGTLYTVDASSLCNSVSCL